MKFVVSSSELLKKLLIVNGAVSTNAIKPNLDDFLFELTDNVLRISANDLETAIRTDLTVETEEEGSAAITAKILVDALKSLPQQPITIEINEDLRQATITSNTGKYKLACDDPADSPAFPVPAEQALDLVLPGDVILAAINRTLFATSSDEVRLAMTGVLFNIDFEKIHFVATDAHKLVKFTYQGLKSEDSKSLIVPKKGLNLLKSILPDNTDVTVKYDDKNITFHFQDTMMSLRLVDSQYPNYSGVIPASNPIVVTIERFSLLNALRRILIFANKTTNQIVLHINQNAIVIEAQDIDLANEATETVACSYDDEPITIAFNGKFLIEMLSVLDSEEIILELSSPSKAGIILPGIQPEDENLLMLIMPVMVTG